MAINFTVLKSELQADPSALGYGPHMTSGNDSALADLLNQVRVAIQIQSEIVTAALLFEAIVPSEWAAASTQEKERVQLILSMGEVNLKGTNTRAALGAAFGPATATRANMIALQTRDGSRVEQVFGAGTSVSVSDIAQARVS